MYLLQVSNIKFDLRPSTSSNFNQHPFLELRKKNVISVILLKLIIIEIKELRGSVPSESHNERVCSEPLFALWINIFIAKGVFLV